MVEYINSTTDPTEVNSILEKLKVPPSGSKRQGFTHHWFLRDYEARAMKFADDLERMLAQERKESLAVMDMFKSGDTSGLSRAISAIGDAYTVVNTLKSFTTPVGLLETGAKTLSSMVSFMVNNLGTNRVADQTSYSFKNQLKDEMGEMLGPFGELGGIIAGSIGELFGAESIAQKNDASIRQTVNFKYTVGKTYIDDFKKWWKDELARTAKQEIDIQVGVDKNNKISEERMAYGKAVYWMKRLTDDEYRERFGDINRPVENKYLSFEDWQRQGQDQLKGGSASSLSAASDVGRPLSGSEVQAWLPGARMFTFKELRQLHSLDELLGPAKTAIILYEVRPNNGHWCAVFQRPNGVIECFDSLGFAPDAELGFIPKEFAKESQQDHTHLLKLLAGSRNRIEYNEDALQRDQRGISTCGRWAVYRVAHRDKSIKQFQGYVRKHGIDDAAVTKLIPNQPIR